MSRNSDRLGLSSTPEQAEAPPAMSLLNFVSPTEFVTLPSNGIGYPKNHPLCGKKDIEIKYMTAKDEDILSNQAYIQKGIAVERMLENIIVDKSIVTHELLSCDRNAIMVQARGTAYGYDYEGIVRCPECETTNNLIFDLRTPKFIGGFKDTQEIIKISEDGYFTTTMPKTKFKIKFRIANGLDEQVITEKIIKEEFDFGLLQHYKRIIIEVEQVTDKEIIGKYIDNMPISDSEHLQMCLKHCSPEVKITSMLKCKKCEHEKEVDVQFGTDFFWPKFGSNGENL